MGIISSQRLLILVELPKQIGAGLDYFLTWTMMEIEIYLLQTELIMI